jgi:hypothetical protein
MMPFIRFASALFMALPLAAMSMLHAAAQETEVREFAIDIEGKTAGKYTMTMTKQEDGTLSMQGQADISTKVYYVYNYTYAYRGVEHWRGGRLIQLTSSCNDDGKRTEVNANIQDNQLLIKVNGNAPRTCRWDVWTTTYWMLADQRFHDKTVPLLDADTGKEYLAQLKSVGRESVPIGGKNTICYHFRVTGGPTSPCDLWFDEQQRLVRQEFTDQGKRVTFNLTSVRRQQ